MIECASDATQKTAEADPAKTPRCYARGKHDFTDFSCAADKPRRLSQVFELTHCVVEQAMQFDHSLGTEATIQFELRLLPRTLSVGTLGAASVGRFGKTAACIVTGLLAHPAPRNQRLQIACEGRRIDAHLAREIGGTDRTERHHVENNEYWVFFSPTPPTNRS